MSEDFKAKLLQRRVGQATVELPGLGTVTVRGLTRTEVLRIQDQEGKRQYDAMTIAIGMVDPPFTFEEAQQWQDVSPAAELDLVTDKIAELSGMTKTAGTKAYLKMENDPGAEFRVSTGAETQPDGSGVAGVD